MSSQTLAAVNCAHPAPSTKPQSAAALYGAPFLSGVALMLGANGIYALCLGAMLSVISKLGTVEMVGKYALALAIATPIMTCANMQLRSVYVADRRTACAFRTYFSTRILSSSVALLVIVIVGIAARYPADIVVIILTVGAAKGVESLSDILLGTLQRQAQFGRFSIAVAIRGVAPFAAATAALCVTQSLTATLMSWCLGYTGVFLFCDLPLSRRHDSQAAMPAPRTSSGTLGQALALTRKSAGLGVVTLLTALAANMPRYVVESVAGARALGLFAAIGYMTVIAGLAGGAVGQTVIVQLSESFSNGRIRGFVSRIAWWMAAGGVCGLALWACARIMGDSILRTFFTAEYVGNTTVLCWMVVATTVSYGASILSYAVLAAGVFSRQIPVLIATVLLGWCASVPLTRAYGLPGAAAAQAVIAALQVAGYCALLGAAIYGRTRDAA